jgi:CRISPR-associated protein Cmr6
MSSTRPLYQESGTAPATYTAQSSNTGLWYNKFCDTWEIGSRGPYFWDIKNGKFPWINKVTHQPSGDGEQLGEYADRIRQLAERRGGTAVALVTATRFATGLGYDHPIENGLAWHHTLGTPYLPGSSVKGLLRACVREWHGVQLAAELFGEDDLQKDTCVGKWIFFDAIPTRPVKLEAEVMTPHYSPYYQENKPPGDWHDPVPIPFLAVDRDQHFQFAFAPRDCGDTGVHEGQPVSTETMARWLRSALHWLGAGAKTNSGFGVFRDKDAAVAAELASAAAPKTRRSFTATLELVTPAFLAGADQTSATDCDLRPATLRGQLRYWWRTMHAGYLTVAELRELEAKLWGDTNGAGAIRVVVNPDVRREPELFSFKERGSSKMEAAFAKKHEIEFVTAQNGNSPLTQGLFYASYGMDEKTKRRYFRPPGSTWRVDIQACATQFRSSMLPPESVIAEAASALSLLCRYGGVGARARKGFGSLTLRNFEGHSNPQCETAAIALRRLANLNGAFRQSEAQSSSLRQLAQLRPLQIDTPWFDYWFLLDQLGASMQAFVQAPTKTGHGKHCESKRALGLPRQIHGPRREPLPHQKITGGHTPPTHLSSPTGSRHASPVHYHVTPSPTGLRIVVTAFPTANLPDLNTSTTILTKLLEHLDRDLTERCRRNGARGQLTHSPSSPTPTARTLAKRPARTPVKVKILNQRAKGGYEVQEEGHVLGILNLGTVPTPPPEIGSFVDVVIKDDARPPQYEWPGVVKPPQKSEGKKRPR